MQLEVVIAEERNWLVEHLKMVHTTMSDVVSQIPPDLWTRGGTPQHWSPAEIVEHTLLVDDEILSDVRSHLQDQPSPDWERVTSRKDAVLKHYLPNIGRARADARASTFKGVPQHAVQGVLAKTHQSVEEILDKGSGAALKAIVWSHGGFGRSVPINGCSTFHSMPNGT